jgi:protoporphyrinogen oxidase
VIATASPRNVVVVGAGFAGLSAAFRLAAGGHRVTVLERATRAGGRAAAAEGEGDPIAARVTSADHALFALIRAAGLATSFLPVRPVRSAWARNGRLIAIPPGADPRSVAASPGIRWLDALRLVRLPRLLARYRANLDAAAPERAAPHDDRSLADFGTLYFGRSVVAGFFEPWLAERAPLDERVASRAAFLMRVESERDAVAGSLGGPAARLAAALAARLEVRSGVAVDAVEARAGAGLRVAIGAETIDADAVVLAVPAGESARIGDAVLVAAERTLLAGVRYDAAITWTAPAHGDASQVPSRVRIAPRGASPFSSIAIVDGVVTAIAREPWVGTHAAWFDDALAKEIGGEVDRLLPGLVAGSGSVRRFPIAWPRFDVGHYRAIARLRAVEADRVAAGRSLYFAGDWLAAPTLDGAVASGARIVL